MKVTDMQAAIGVSQLMKVDDFGMRRRRNHAALTRMLQQAGLDREFILPKATKGADPSWFGYLLTLREGTGLKRSDIVQALEKRKVGTRNLFAGNLTRQPAFHNVNYRIAVELKNTDRVMRDSFWIGVWPGIRAKERQYMVGQLSDIIQALRK